MSTVRLVSSVALATLVLCICQVVALLGPRMCQHEGVNPNPYDRSQKTFVNCHLVPIKMHCPNGLVFSAKQGDCVERSEVPIDWSQYLHCPLNSLDEFYRNPYNCSLFYRCYRQGDLIRLAPGECVSTMYFDEVLDTCLPIDEFVRLHGPCPVKPLPVHNSF